MKTFTHYLAHEFTALRCMSRFFENFLKLSIRCGLEALLRRRCVINNDFLPKSQIFEDVTDNEDKVLYFLQPYEILLEEGVNYCTIISYDFILYSNWNSPACHQVAETEIF